MIRRTLGPALLDPFTRWRVSLVVLAIIGVPLVLPFVVLQAVTALSLTRGVDPVMLQHARWIMGAPETLNIFVGAWLLYFGPWVLGIWGSSVAGGVRLWIGWECYGRYLAVIVCAGLVTIMDGAFFALIAAPFVVQLIAEILADGAALYVFLRLAPAGLVIRAGGLLHLYKTWQGTAQVRWPILRVALSWIVLAIIIATVAEILSVVISYAAGGVDPGQSMVLLWIILGAPGLIGGCASAYVMLVCIALFWRVGDAVLQA